MSVFRHVHSSSRFSVAPTVLEKYLDEYMADADLITITEIDKNSRARRLSERGWASVFGDKGPRDDCGIAWRTSLFTKVWAETLTLSTARYMNERGWEADTTEGAFAVLEDSSGQRIVVGVAHMPHGMQTELRNNNPRSDVARAFIKISAAFRDRAAALAKRFGAKATMLVADWNLNIKAAWVRAWFRLYARGFKTNWTRPFPRLGSHGDQIIDVALLHRIKLLNRPHLRRHDPSSDHTAWREVLAA